MALPMQMNQMNPQQMKPQQSGLSSFFLGTPETTQNFQRFTNPQQNLQNQSIQKALGLLQGGPESRYEGFAPIAQEARKGFNEQVVPSLSERFTSMGGAGTGALSSPAFASQLGQAGAGLEQGIAALRSQYGLQMGGQQQNQLANLLGFAMNPSFEQTYVPANKGALQGGGEALLEILPRLLAAYFTGGGSLAAEGGINALKSLSGGQNQQAPYQQQNRMMGNFGNSVGQGFGGQFNPLMAGSFGGFRNQLGAF